MTADGGAAGYELPETAALITSNPPEQGQFDDHSKNDSRGGSNGHSSGHSETRHRSSRDDKPRRSRSKDRDQKSSRSNRSR